jgi:hypothetical protein
MRKTQAFLHLQFFPFGTNSLCTMPWESKKYQHGLGASPLDFQFLRPRGCLTNPFRIPSLYFGVITKTQSPISRNNFVKKFLSASAIAIIFWQEVIRSSLCSGVKECGTKRVHNFLFPKSSFRILRTTVLGMFKDSAVILEQISNSSNVYLSSSRFWTVTSLFIFYQPPSVSKSRIPPKNIWSVQIRIPVSLLHQS